MKSYIALGAILLVILNGLLLLPATGGHTVPIAGLALVLAILVLVFALIGGRGARQRKPSRSQPLRPRPRRSRSSLRRRLPNRLKRRSWPSLASFRKRGGWSIF